MKQDTREIISVIFIVGWIILAVLGRWYLGFIFIFLWLFLPKSREQKAESLRTKMMFHLFQKRDWKEKEKVRQELGKELKEMEQIADEIEKE